MGSMWRNRRWSLRRRGWSKPRPFAGADGAARPRGAVFLYAAVMLLGIGVGLAGFLKIRTAPSGGNVLPALSGFLLEGERRIADGARAAIGGVAPDGLVGSAIPMFARIRADGAARARDATSSAVRSLLFSLSQADIKDPSTFLTIGIAGFSMPPQAVPAASRARLDAGGSRATESATAGTVAPGGELAPDEGSTLEHPPSAGPSGRVPPQQPTQPPVVVPRPAPSEAETEQGLRIPTRSWGDKPLVFIYHSHSSESYRLTSGADHVWGSEEGVIAVGAALARALSEKYNIPVVHSRKIHDYPVWRDAYTNSYKTVSEALEKYPTIEMVFDVHRDAGTDRLSSPATVEIGGRRAARVFIVVTTDRFGLPHPNWRENLAFAYQLNAKMDEMYPGLSRGINVRDDARWNQHVHNRAVILEIGCEQNTRQEAESAAAFLADVVASVLEDIQR